MPSVLNDIDIFYMNSVNERLRCLSVGQDYRSAEKGKVLLYTTGVKVVRDTYDKCLRVKKILQTHMVRYEERDISMSRDNHRQLAERLGLAGTSTVELPQVFADGLHIGVGQSLPKAQLFDEN